MAYGILHNEKTSNLFFSDIRCITGMHISHCSVGQTLQFLVKRDPWDLLHLAAYSDASSDKNNEFGSTDPVAIFNHSSLLQLFELGILGIGKVRGGQRLTGTKITEAIGIGSQHICALE